MDIVITPFRPELAEAFGRLNRAWIERFFRIEAPDLEVLDQPYRSVVLPGGQIYFALLGDEVVGTAAAIRNDGGRIELAKMAVSPTHQGMGIGRLLGQAVIEFARESGANMVFLLTNSSLAPAIHLYQRLGFRHAPLPPDNGYSRADVYMELTFD